VNSLVITLSLSIREQSDAPYLSDAFIRLKIMPHRTTRYPLGKLLLECLRTSELSLQPFVLSLGYRNANKGIRAFDNMLAKGHADNVFLERLSRSAHAPDTQALHEALTQTSLLLEEERQQTLETCQQRERDTFKPFFQAVPELHTPTQLCIFALTGGHSGYTHLLPASLPSWPLVDQYRYLAKKVPLAFAASGGKTPFMGRITSYRLFRWHNAPALLLSVHGKPLWQEASAPLPEVRLDVGGRPISSAHTRALSSALNKGLPGGQPV
jgi:hypothetical protein